jgi:hypothetical protein
MMYLNEFLKKRSGNEGNHWIGYHIIMDQIRKYESEYNVKILVVVDDQKP